MVWPGYSNLSPIGLDLGTHSFKAVQIRFGKSDWELFNAVSIARDDPGKPLTTTELVRLAGVLDRRGFSGREVVVSIPAAKLLTAMLELPPRAAGVPMDQIASLEFARVHKKELSQLTLSTWELPEPSRASKGTYMLGVGANSADLESHLDVIEAAGLDVIAMQEPYSAASTGCLAMLDSAKGLTGIIDFGWTTATLTIVRDQTIVYTRKLASSGMDRLCTATVEAAGIDESIAAEEIWQLGFEEAVDSDSQNSDARDCLSSHFAGIVKEVAQAFSYASHRYADTAISKAIVIGGGGLIPGLATRLEMLLGVPTQLGRTMQSTAKGTDAGAACSSALGLALWQGEDHES